MSDKLNKIEINDLIDDAIKNAVARRQEALDSEEALLSMSDAETKSVAGGALKLVPITLGRIFLPTTIGIIAAPPKTLYL